MSQVFTCLEIDVHSDQAETRSTNPLRNRLRAALEHARRVTMMYEEGQIEIALAWETVEELTKAQRHQRALQPTNFELYCLMHPEAPECRIYDL
jgi:hypothetical protein